MLARASWIACLCPLLLACGPNFDWPGPPGAVGGGGFDAGPGPEAGGTLLAQIAYPSNIVVNGDYAYVTAGAPGYAPGQVARVSLDGGTLVVLTESGGPWELAVDDTAVYWADLGSKPGAVLSVAKDGGPVTTLASGQVPFGVAVDDSYVYWTDRIAGDVWRMAKDGGAPLALASGQPSPEAIGVDSTHVYWTYEDDLDSGYDGGLRRVARDGGAAEQLASGLIIPWGLAMDDAGVYVSGFEPDVSQGAIVRFDKNTRKVAVVTTGAGVGGVVAVANSRVYFSDGSQSVSCVAAMGGTPVLVAEWLDNPMGIAVAGGRVYWVDMGQPGEMGDLRVATAPP